MMREMMEEYTKDEFSSLACHGFRILAETIALNRSYRIDCPCLLLCGSHDKAGSARRYNRVWARKEHLPLIWIPNAGHNVNADDLPSSSMRPSKALCKGYRLKNHKTIHQHPIKKNTTADCNESPLFSMNEGLRKNP